MGAFVVIKFADATMIPRGIESLKKLHSEDSIKVYASAIVARDAAGTLSVEEVTKEGLGGTAVGALIGALAGAPVGPLAATIGAAAGALIGRSSDLLNERDEDEFAEKISKELAPGKSAIVAEIAEEGLSPLVEAMGRIGGTVVQR